MSKRTATWLAWSICALSLALTALSLLLIALILSYPNVHIFEYWLETTVAPAAFPTVGAVIVSRHPNNVIGWLFCALGFSLGLNHFLSEYAIYALLAQPGSLPGGEVFAWLTYSLYVPTFSPIIFSLLLFPTGRLPSSRWRWFAGFSAIAILVGTVTASFSSMHSAIGPVPNPLGIESLGDVSLIAGRSYTLLHF